MLSGKQGGIKNGDSDTKMSAVIHSHASTLSFAAVALQSATASRVEAKLSVVSGRTSTRRHVCLVRDSETRTITEILVRALGRARTPRY